MLLLLSGIVFYIGWNGAVFLHAVAPSVSTAVFWMVYVPVALAYLIAMLIRRAIPYVLYKLIKLIGSYALGVLYYSLLLLPFGDLAVLLLRLGGTGADSAVAGVGTAVLLVIALLLAFGSWNAWRPIVRRYDIAIPKQAGSRSELRLAVASDLHLGAVVGKRHLSRLVKRMNALRPDLILLPGDVLDDSIEPFVRENMAETMRGLQAPLGVYASLGNHEYIGGHIDEYVERMKAIGIEVLVDRAVKVDDAFYVAGRKDLAAKRFTKEGRLPLKELLSGLDRSLPVLLLDHQPGKPGAAAEAGVDLKLSGHTHRGQMAPNHWITGRLFDLDWGYARKGSMHAIVSSGFGTWGPPIRLGSRSELLDIRIAFGSSE